MCEPRDSRGTGVPPVIHVQDARATTKRTHHLHLASIENHRV